MEKVCVFLVIASASCVGLFPQPCIKFCRGPVDHLLDRVQLLSLAILHGVVWICVHFKVLNIPLELTFCASKKPSGIKHCYTGAERGMNQRDWSWVLTLCTCNLTFPVEIWSVIPFCFCFSPIA